MQWEKENCQEYEAAFLQDGAKYAANFGLKGKWVETEEYIAYNKLPTAVAAAFENKYKGWQCTAASKITTATKGIRYEVEMKKGKVKKEALFTENGAFIKSHL